MKTRLLIIGMIVFSFTIPHSFGDNEFCNIMENLKIQEELIKDNIVLIEFLKVFPDAKLIRANFVEWSNPEQTSMTWTVGVYSLDIHIWRFDDDDPSDCFFPGGYRLNAPHLPEMTGNDYHKDTQIVLDQIDELEPKYVKGGPAREPIQDSKSIPDENQNSFIRINDDSFTRQSLQTGETISESGTFVSIFVSSFGAILIVLFIVIYVVKKRKKKIEGRK